ncbi:unnamed protein product [Paramecium sonneborni]|uniref:Uncharacterized protein n=1 Tax=Paramecium sonneborni TaxID=65129 RepID=A0A8S1QQZ8_9CILI|nr:unnamed protein product [Paramecium sonneborni]
MYFILTNSNILNTSPHIRLYNLYTIQIKSIIEIKKYSYSIDTKFSVRNLFSYNSIKENRLNSDIQRVRFCQNKCYKLDIQIYGRQLKSKLD